MDINRICIDCFQDTGGEEVCMSCGYVQNCDGPEDAIPPRSLLNKYIIGRVLNTEGNVFVYKAYDTSLGRVVALRELFPVSEGSVYRIPGSCEVMVREEAEAIFEKQKKDFITRAQVIRRCAQDNIILFYDEFEENGTAYQVTEFVEGLTLEQYFGQVEKFTFEQALDILSPVMDAVSALHAENVIYPSISPKHIYITINSDIKLGGFRDICISQQESANYRSAVSDGYTAPEALSGAGLSEASDVYSLAAVWYKMLGGADPVKADGRKNSDKTIHAGIEQLNAPEYVKAVIEKALSKKPRDRFATVGEFMTSLRGEGWKPKQKKNVLPVILSVAAVLVILTVGLTTLKFVSDKSIVPNKSTEIELWYPASEDEAVNKRWEKIGSDYSALIKDKNKFGNVEITLKTKAIDRKKYKAEIKKALKDGTAPDVYCSAELTDNSAAFPLEELYREIDKSEVGFTGAFDTMRSIFEPDNKIAFCYDVNVLYVSVKGNSKDVPDSDTELDDLINWEDNGRDFSKPFICSPGSVLFGAYAYGYNDGKSTKTLKNLYDNARVSTDWRPSDIIDASTKFCLGRISDYYDFYSRTEYFRMIKLTGKDVSSRYIYPEVWSINDDSEENVKKAAVYLMYYLLTSTEGQKNTIDVSNKTYYLPFNAAAADKLEDIYKTFTDKKCASPAKTAEQYAIRADKALRFEKLALDKNSSRDDFNKAAEIK